jgi:hypothetical protein
LEYNGFQTVHIASRDFPGGVFRRADVGITGFVFQALSRLSGRVEYHYVVTEAGRIYYKRPSSSVYTGPPPGVSVP